MNVKVLLLIALTLLATISAIATIAVTLNVPATALFSITKTKMITTSFGNVQPTGDPVDNPVAPS